MMYVNYKLAFVTQAKDAKDGSGRSRMTKVINKYIQKDTLGRYIANPSDPYFQQVEEKQKKQYVNDAAKGCLEKTTIPTKITATTTTTSVMVSMTATSQPVASTLSPSCLLYPVSLLSVMSVASLCYHCLQVVISYLWHDIYLWHHLWHDICLWHHLCQFVLSYH